MGRSVGIIIIIIFSYMGFFKQHRHIYGLYTTKFLKYIIFEPSNITQEVLNLGHSWWFSCQIQNNSDIFSLSYRKISLGSLKFLKIYVNWRPVLIKMSVLTKNVRESEILKYENWGSSFLNQTKRQNKI